MMQVSHTPNKLSVERERSFLKNYLPLIIGSLLVMVISSILELLRHNTGSSLTSLMNNFMGCFFVIFALPKLIDIAGFANSFAQYDIIGHRSKFYAEAYPFIEICLGVCFLSGLLSLSILASQIVNVIVIAITGTALYGISRSIRKKQNLSCACMGSLFKFPLSKIALLENGLMLIMALVMLIFSHHGSMIMALTYHLGNGLL